MPVAKVIDAVTGRDPGPLREIVLKLRLPRTLEALSVGAALGVAGALLPARSPTRSPRPT